MHHQAGSVTVPGLSSTTTALSLGAGATLDTSSPAGSNFYTYGMVNVKCVGIYIIEATSEWRLFNDKMKRNSLTFTELLLS